MLASICLAQAESATPRIVLEDATAFAGESAILPVRIAEGPPVIQFRLKLSYPRELAFVEVRRGKAVPKLRLTTTPGQESEGSDATLLVEAVSPEALPPGRVLDLVFQTNKETFEAKDLTITVAEARLLAADGTAVENAAARSGRVTVSVPLFSCFFYMH
jgi:hypothetical protein